MYIKIVNMLNLINKPEGGGGVGGDLNGLHGNDSNN